MQFHSTAIHSQVRFSCYEKRTRDVSSVHKSHPIAAVTGHHCICIWWTAVAAGRVIGSGTATGVPRIYIFLFAKKYELRYVTPLKRRPNRISLPLVRGPLVGRRRLPRS